jgi:hypothetical protein
LPGCPVGALELSQAAAKGLRGGNTVIRRICSGSLLLSFLFLLSAPPGRAQTAPPSGAPSSAPAQVDPKVTAVAKDWLHRAQTANIDRSQLTDSMSTALTPAIVKQVAAELAPLGDPTAFTFVESQSVQGIAIYHFVLTFPAGTLNEYIGIDGTGKIAGLRFTPAAQ